MGEAECIAKHADELINRPESSKVRVEASISAMDQGEPAKFPLIVYAHPEYLIKPWPREALIVVWFPSLYEEQNYGKKHIYNKSNNMELYAIYCSQRHHGEQLGFKDIWEAAPVELEIARLGERFVLDTIFNSRLK